MYGTKQLATYTLTQLVNFLVLDNTNNMHVYVIYIAIAQKLVRKTFGELG